MSLALTSPEAYRIVTEGVLDRLSASFPGWSVAISTEKLSALKRQASANGLIRITPIGWEHLDASTSKAGCGIALYYAIYIGIPFPGLDWESFLPASQAPFRVYDILRFMKFTEYPAIQFLNVTDKVFSDTETTEDGHRFHSVLTVSFLTGDLARNSHSG